jgi:hypothetical protein
MTSEATTQSMDSDDGAGRAYDSAMDRRTTSLEAKWDAVIPTLATKVDIEKAVAEGHRWMIGTAIGLFVGFGGLFMAMSNALKPTPTAQLQPPAPVVIYLPPANQAPTAPAR